MPGSPGQTYSADLTLNVNGQNHTLQYATTGRCWTLSASSWI